jgi:hypothetical protein
MTVEVKDGVVAASGTLTVDEAELLLQLALAHPGAAADLGACDHVHSAALQVLMASSLRIIRWPEHAELAAWLRAALGTYPSREEEVDDDMRVGDA